MSRFVYVFLIINVCNYAEVNSNMTSTTDLQQFIEHFSMISDLESIPQNVPIAYFIIIMISCMFGCGCGVLCLCLCTFLCIAIKNMKHKKSHRIQRIYSNTETVNKDKPLTRKVSDIYSYAIPWNFPRFSSFHGRKGTVKNRDESIHPYAVRHSDLRKEFDLTYACTTSDIAQTV